MSSSEDSDALLRVQTFAFVQKLREQFAGRIPSAALSAGVILDGQRIPIWNYQRGIHKPEVLGREGAALTIHTSANSPYDDSHDEATGRFLYKYQGKDPLHHDNVALRRAMLHRRPLLYLYAVDRGYYDAITPVYVISDDSSSLTFELVADQIALGAPEPDSPMLALRRQYVTRAVVQRLHQQQFRRLVLGAYRNQCAVCRLRHLELLDAAHILSDRHPLGEPVVTNGLGMCKIHHSAYDANILGIDPDARVHIRSDILAEIDGPMLKHGLQAVHDTKIVLPRSSELHPNRDFLAERFDRFRAA